VTKPILRPEAAKAFIEFLTTPVAACGAQGEGLEPG
jgi:hypothetical protein